MYEDICHIWLIFIVKKKKLKIICIIHAIRRGIERPTRIFVTKKGHKSRTSRVVMIFAEVPIYYYIICLRFLNKHKK